MQTPNYCCYSDVHARVGERGLRLVLISMRRIKDTWGEAGFRTREVSSARDGVLMKPHEADPVTVPIYKPIVRTQLTPVYLTTLY